MKRSLTFIIIFIFVVFLFVAFWGNNTDYSNADYNQDLLLLSENFDNKQITLCDEIPIDEIFIPNGFLVAAGRPFFYNDIEKYIKIENVQQTKYGFNIIFKSENQNLFIATNLHGQIKNMGVFGEKMHNVRECLKIKEGMSLEEVKEVFPDSQFITKYSKIFGVSSLKWENPYIEIVCNDGTNFAFYFVEKNGVYYVDYILEHKFDDYDIIKSWRKLFN